MEYADEAKVTPVWGWTNYTKQLEGFIINNQAYGKDLCSQEFLKANLLLLNNV